jgi:hypothetical protein
VALLSVLGFPTHAVEPIHGEKMVRDATR